MKREKVVGLEYVKADYEVRYVMRSNVGGYGAKICPLLFHGCPSLSNITY